jgi:O-antigen ligase
MRGSAASDHVSWPLVAAIVVTTVAMAAVTASRASASLLMVLCGGLGLAALFRQPALGMVAIAVLAYTLPLELGTGSEVSLTAPVILIPAVVLAWLADALRTRTLRLPSSPTVLPLLLLTGSCLLSLLAGTAYWDPMVPRPANLLLVQLGQVALFVLSAALFLATAELGVRPRWLERATYGFLAVGGLAGTVGYVVPNIARALHWPIARMLNGAMFWAWLGALATGQLVHNRRLRLGARLGLVLLLGMCTYVLWYLQRDWISGWFPFTLAVVSVAWLRVWRSNRLVGLVTGAIALALAVLAFPLVYDYVGGDQQIQLSWGGREVLYQAVLDLVEKHPILGLGPAAYRHYALTRWLSLGAGRALYLRPLVSSHNNFIDIYAQMGLVGLVLFVWFLVAVAVVGWRLAPRFRGNFEEGYVVGTLGGLAATIAAMMLVDWLLPFVYNVGFAGFRTSALPWMFLGGLVALDQVRRAAAREPKPESSEPDGGEGGVAA